MLRVVIDTNVVVSALNFGGNPKNVLELARKKRIQNFTSPFIIDEVKKVLRQKFSWQKEMIREVLTDFKTFSNIIDPPETLTAVSHLPDNRILECAVVGGADYLISGDRHLIDRGQHLSSRRVNTVWQAAATKAGLKITPYEATRHSFASQAVSSGVPEKMIGDFLGHKDASTTRRYAKMKADALRTVIETVESQVAD